MVGVPTGGARHRVVSTHGPADGAMRRRRSGGDLVAVVPSRTAAEMTDAAMGTPRPPAAASGLRRRADRDATDPGEQVVVVDPDGADVEDGGQVGEIGRPLRETARGRTGPGRRSVLQVEDQEGEGDGEDAVAEGLNTGALGQALGRCTLGGRLVPYVTRAAATASGTSS